MTSSSLSTLTIAEGNEDFETAADSTTAAIATAGTSSSKSAGKKTNVGKPEVLRLRSCKALRALHRSAIVQWCPSLLLL